MAWMRDDDGLKLVGDCHYDACQVGLLIRELRGSRNQPGKVCDLLESLLATGRVTKELVWRLSKWCHWKDRSTRTAQRIAELLFYSNICRRLWDERDHPIPDHATAELDYETWLERVVRAGGGLAPDAIYPDDVVPVVAHYEGAARPVVVNAYERDPVARAKCIAHYGAACIICGFDFGTAYSGIGRGYIHVHHLRPLSEVGSRHAVDPVADLRPVCPNCHAVIHLNRQPFTVEEVKEMIRRAREVCNPEN